MKFMKRVPILVALFLLNLDVGYGCTCIGPANGRGGLAKAEAVFSGRVIRADDYEYAFEVERVWKGKIERSRLTVAATAPNTSCAIELNQGERYIVFALTREEGGRVIYYPQICNFTSVFSKAGQTLKEIGRGRLLKKQQASRKK